MDVAGDLASVFHFPPSEIWAMTPADFMAWHDQAVRVTRAKYGGDEDD
ncbi:MAG: GpE family phage tail protein [Alphaproteobacteria bacterium]|nr:GpE family phage tail protein [Alphaproteobacteria bacterium]